MNRIIKILLLLVALNIGFALFYANIRIISYTAGLVFGPLLLGIILGVYVD